MSEMRLIVAGAGGRMGRTLVKAIADNKQFVLAGALEDARSPLIGWDAGVLAGPGQNDIKLKGDAARSWTRPTASSIHRPGGDRRFVGAGGARPQGAHHRHHRLLAADEAHQGAAKTRGDRQVGQYEPRRQSAGALVERVGQDVDDSFDIEILEMHHNQKVDAPSGTALLLGRAAAKAAASISTGNGARPRRATPARASAAISALPVCAAAAWSASTR